MNHTYNIYFAKQKIDETNFEAISTVLFDDYGKLLDTEKKELLKFFISNNEVDKILLNFIFKHYHPKKNDLNENEFIKNTKKILYKFSKILFELEDNKWNFHKYPSTRFEITKNEFIFENTISFIDKDEFEEKLSNLVRILNETTKIIKVKYCLIKDDENIYNVLLFCKKIEINK